MPNRPQLVAFVAVLALLGAFILALIALTPAEGRPALQGALLSYLPAVGAGVTLLATLLGLRNLSAETSAQTTTLAKIDRQTNGVLTERIRVAVAEALIVALPAVLPPPIPLQRQGRRPADTVRDSLTPDEGGEPTAPVFP